MTAFLAPSLGGCVEQFPEAQVSRGNVRAAIMNGSLASPRNATVALASLDGAPDSVAARFQQSFKRLAADREIVLTDPSTSHYLVRGYLSAYAAENGTEFSYVYDIYDSERRRIERVADVLTVPGSGQDSWARLDDRAMESLAGRSADDLAVALARTPEAGAARAPTVQSASATPTPSH